jgi:hypothetical protein
MKRAQQSWGGGRATASSATKRKRQPKWEALAINKAAWPQLRQAHESGPSELRSALPHKKKKVSDLVLILCGALPRITWLGYRRAHCALA